MNGYLKVEIVKPDFIKQLALKIYKRNSEKAKRTKTIFPLTVFKQPNEYDNEVKLDFFVNSVLERFNRNF